MNRVFSCLFALSALFVLSACPSTDRPVADDRLMSTLSPAERTDWCSWRAETLGVDADGMVCADAPWPAGTAADCEANEDLFVECEAGLAADCIEAAGSDPCTDSAACAAWEACVDALPPSNAIQCSVGECSCTGAANATGVSVSVHRYQGYDYCWPDGDDQVCPGSAYPTSCW